MIHDDLQTSLATQSAVLSLPSSRCLSVPHWLARSQSSTKDFLQTNGVKKQVGIIKQHRKYEGLFFQRVCYYLVILLCTQNQSRVLVHHL